jgi:oligopeptide transport system substrate-binding protein
VIGRRLLLAGGICLLAACSSPPRPPLLPNASPPPGTLKVGVAQLPTETDPARAPVYGAGIVRAAYEPLLRLRPDLRGVEPAAAADLSVSADGLTYSFHLQPRARWSDGQAVVAADFVRAWRRVLDPRVNSPAGETLALAVKNGAAYEDLDPVKDAAKIPGFLDQLGIAAPDAQTFTVQLARPSPSFRELVTMPELSPVRLAADGSPAAVYNGAFRPQLSAGEVNLLPLDTYWGGKPRLARVQVVARPAAGDELAAFERGDYGLLSLDPGAVESARKAGELQRQLAEMPRLETTWVQFNVHRAPFDNPAVRLAFAEAIDRSSLAAGPLQGAAQPTTGLIPRGMRDQRDLAAQAFDANRCRATLDASGVSPADLASIHLLVRDVALDKSVAQFVAQQVHDHLGIQLTLDVLPSKKVTAQLWNGDFQMEAPGGWIADYPDEQDWLDQFLTGQVGGQFSRYSNPAFDKLVKQADVEPQDARRQQLYLQAAQLLANDAPVAFLYQPVDVVLHQDWVSGLALTGMDDWPGDLFAGDLVASTH